MGRKGDECTRELTTIRETRVLLSDAQSVFRRLLRWNPAFLARCHREIWFTPRSKWNQECIRPLCQLWRLWGISAWIDTMPRLFRHAAAMFHPVFFIDTSATRQTFNWVPKTSYMKFTPSSGRIILVIFLFLTFLPSTNPQRRLEKLLESSRGKFQRNSLISRIVGTSRNFKKEMGRKIVLVWCESVDIVSRIVSSTIVWMRGENSQDGEQRSDAGAHHGAWNVETRDGRRERYG